jgi:DNA-binding SARP family transcriptional activator
MAQLSISLFGGIQVTPDGFQLKSSLSEKERALLVFLVVENNRPHSRSYLAALLWPDQPEASSHSNLRQNLHRLRQAIGDSQAAPPYLLITAREIQFNNKSDYWLDVAEFNRTLDDCKRNHQGSASLSENILERLKSAIDLYKGDLLDGFSLRNCRQFEYWLLGKQEEFHHQVLEILDRLVGYYESIQAYSQAIQYAQRAIELEPWRELAHRQRMRALALSGQRCDALHQYEICRKILARELGVEPNADTNRLYQKIRAGLNSINLLLGLFPFFLFLPDFF